MREGKKEGKGMKFVGCVIGFGGIDAPEQKINLGHHRSQ